MTDCCTVDVSRTPIYEPGTCPESGRRGKPVERITLQSLLATDLRELRDEVDYLFCSTAECETVYFSVDGTQTYTREQLQVPVFEKEPWNDVPVCYCFGFTPDAIRAEIVDTGKSTAVDQITQGVRDGKCACEITNPKGSCCLGNVRQVVRAVEEHMY